jgi:cytochrome c biogenesis protein CcdA
MLSTLAIVVVIALLDSTSMVPIALVPLAAMLGAAHPYGRSLGLIAGIGLSYLLAGILLLLGLSQLFALLDAYFERVWFEPNRLELALQIAIGLVLLALAWRMVSARASAGRPEPRTGGIAAAFSLGAVLTLVGLPGAVPYVGAIDQILRADVAPPAAGLLLLAYNLAFVAPLLVLVGLCALFRDQLGQILARLAALMARWGTRALVLILSLLGAVMVADGIGWFLGHPLIPVGTPPASLSGGRGPGLAHGHHPHLVDLLARREEVAPDLGRRRQRG